VTPFDVVKIRLQAQTKEFNAHKCFLYCNGITEHLCECGITLDDAKKFNTHSGLMGHNRLFQSQQSTAEWFRRPSHFNGTYVSDGFVNIV
jgi:solute carrier family 25 protein 39/40